MGNLFSKRSKVSPLSEGEGSSELKKKGQLKRNWYRGLLCCDRNSVTVIQSLAQNAEPIASSREEMTRNGLKGDKDLQIEACKEADINSSAEFDLTEPRQLQMSPDNWQLLEEAEDDRSRVVRSRLVVRRDEEGHARAVAFDVELQEFDLPNRPHSSLSMSHRADRPGRLTNRLPELSAVTKEEIQRKLSQAVERRDVLMRGRSERIRQKAALSREMLQRLEAEKQRLLREKIDEKERKATEKKEKLKRRKERKAARRSRQTERAKKTAAEKERQNCENAEEVLRAKMRAAEEKKAAVMRAQERKLNAHRLRQIKAKLKMMDEVGENEGSELENRKGSCDDDRFRIPLHLLSKEKRQEARRPGTAMGKIEESVEEFSKDEFKLETYIDDTKHPLEEDSDSEEDSFWN